MRRYLVIISVLLFAFTAAPDNHLYMLLGKRPVSGITPISFDTASAATVSTNSVTTTGSPISTIDADFIEAEVWDLTTTPGSTQTFSDNAVPPNTWIRDTTVVIGTNLRVTVFHCAQPTTSATHTFTYNGGAVCFPSMKIGAWRGVSAVPTIVKNGNSNGGSPTISTGSITPATDGYLLVCAFASYPQTAQATISGGGWLNSDQYYWTGFVNTRRIQGGAWARVQGTAAATNPTISIGGASTQTAALIISFK